MAVDRELAIISLFLLLLTYLWMASLFYRAHRKSPENPVLFAFLLIFVFYFAGRLELGIYDYYLTSLESTRFPEFLLWWKIGMLVHNLSFVVLCFVVERQLFQGRDKYVFFIGFIASLGFMTLMPDLETAEWFTGLGFLFSLFIPIGLLKITINSIGEIRRRVLFAFAGFIVFMFASLIVAQIPIEILTTATGCSRYIIHVFSNGGQILGSVLLARGYL